MKKQHRMDAATRKFVARRQWARSGSLEPKPPALKKLPITTEKMRTRREATAGWLALYGDFISSFSSQTVQTIFKTGFFLGSLGNTVMAAAQQNFTFFTSTGDDFVLGTHDAKTASAVANYCNMTASSLNGSVTTAIPTMISLCDGSLLWVFNHSKSWNTTTDPSLECIKNLFISVCQDSSSFVTDTIGVFLLTAFGIYSRHIKNKYFANDAALHNDQGGKIIIQELDHVIRRQWNPTDQKSEREYPEELILKFLLKHKRGINGHWREKLLDWKTRLIDERRGVKSLKNRRIHYGLLSLVWIGILFYFHQYSKNSLVGFSMDLMLKLLQNVLEAGEWIAAAVVACFYHMTLSFPSIVEIKNKLHEQGIMDIVALPAPGVAVCLFIAYLSPFMDVMRDGPDFNRNPIECIDAIIAWIEAHPDYEARLQNSQTENKSTDSEIKMSQLSPRLSIYQSSRRPSESEAHDTTNQFDIGYR